MVRTETRLELHGNLTLFFEQLLATPERFIELKTLSRAFGFSPDHVSRLFRQILGESPGHFVRRILLERAAQQLQSGDSVLAAAATAGYADSEGFAKAFRKSYGGPPSVYSGDWRLDCLSGLHWSVSPEFQPVMAGVKELGIRMIVRRPTVAHARLFVGDFRSVPDEWQRLRKQVDDETAERRTWLTIFHDDGYKTVDRDNMRSRLGYLAEGHEPLPGFERMIVPGGPYATAKQFSNATEHSKAWEFLNRNWVPKPERKELPGFDLYTRFPAPWSSVAGEIFLGLKQQIVG